MLKSGEKRIYQGKGKRISERGLQPPEFRDDTRLFLSELYEPDDDLLDAVEVALLVGQPLLLTGEPGSGKTQLAHSLAWELGLDLFEFHTKSTSTYMDLLYRYDSLRHFQDVQLREQKCAAEEYVEYGPLGKAIMRAMQGVRSVVLIDEVDKAPRDLPNDILNEIERMCFTVKETDMTFKAASKHRPIVVLTSNQEKDLPEAFRRRCIFYHIKFPEQHLGSIVRKRLGLAEDFQTQRIENAIQHFLEIRKKGLDKPPSTAELIAWIELLNQWELDPKNVQALPAEARSALAASYSLLAKSAEDLKKLTESLLETK